jgi:uncharacterized protein YegP (UPF0339 family)
MDIPTRPPRFSLRRAGLLRNRFRVHLVGANGEQICHTQTFTTIDSALRACALINPAYYVDDYT